MGASVAKAENVIENAVTGAISATMESSVQGSINLSCQNLQIAQDVRNCDVEFADQVCKAVGISNFTSNQSLTGDISQDIMTEITSRTNASTSGLTLQLAQVSDSSNVVKNMTELSMNVSQSFLTDCTRNVTAINEQSVKGCSGSVLRFKPQDVSAEAIGDCVANQVGNLQAAQSVTSVLDVAAEASNEGLQFTELLLFMIIMFVGLFLGIPIALYATRSALGSRLPGEGPPTAGEKARYTAIMFFGVILLLSLIFWYPGLGAWYMGISPWPYPGGGYNDVDGLPNCWKGRNLDKSTFVNTFMWWDPYCLAKTAAIEQNANTEPGFCSTDTQKKHYRNCGLFATVGGCDDPEFKQAETDYVNAVQACAPLAGQVFNRCTLPSIATTLFADEKDAYLNCKRCVGESEAEKSSQDPRALYGLWVNRDGTCSAKTVNGYYYLKTDRPCDPNDPYCKNSVEDLQAYSRDDCIDTAYQTKKRELSKFLRACQDVQATNRITTESEGQMPLLQQQCPPNPFDYLTKCSASTKLCTYRAKGCSCDDANGKCDCSAADPAVVASCRNDLEACCTRDRSGNLVCRDEDYRRDLLVYDVANDMCKSRYEKWSALNPIAWQITLGIYVFTFFVILYLLLTTPNATARYRQGAGNVLSGNTSKFLVLVLGISLVIAGGVMIGQRESANDNFTVEDIRARPLPYSLFFAGVGLFVVVGIWFFVGGKKPETTSSSNNSTSNNSPTNETAPPV